MQQTRIERSLTNYNSLAMNDSSDWAPGDVFSTRHVPGYHPSGSMQTEFTVKTWEITDNASASCAGMFRILLYLARKQSSI